MLRFGIFDHLDDNGMPRSQQFEERLTLIELLEAEGFHAYHLAEHHSTPLGCAPAPSVFLAAAAQRTKRIRLGPLVEHQRYGIEPASAQAMYHEAFEVLMRALATDVLDFDGRFYHFKDYLVQTRPLQQPHPPIWYGIPGPDAVPWAASRGVNVV